MEILKTFIVEYGSYPTDKRFVKIYLTSGGYFLHQKQGAIVAITYEKFKELTTKKI